MRTSLQNRGGANPKQSPDMAFQNKGKAQGWHSQSRNAKEHQHANKFDKSGLMYDSDDDARQYPHQS